MSATSYRNAIDRAGYGWASRSEQRASSSDDLHLFITRHWTGLSTITTSWNSAYTPYETKQPVECYFIRHTGELEEVNAFIDDLIAFLVP